MSMDSLNDLLEDELKDLYSAEKQLTKALPKMAKKATDPKLKEAFTSHLTQTQGHVARLEQIAEHLEIKLSGKVCHAMKGLVEEGSEVIEEEGADAVLDAALIGAAQRVEHYEMAAYGTVVAMARTLGESDIVKLLQQTLAEEKTADQKLTTIAEGGVLQAAASASEEPEQNDAEEKAPARGKSKSKKR